MGINLALSPDSFGNNILDSYAVSKDNKPYNAFEHLWRSVFPLGAKDKVMAMLTAYFDESGTDGRSPIVAVGGYVSTVDLWDAFQREWEKLLTDEGIKVFHTTDMLALKGEFTPENGWSHERVTHVMQVVDSIIEKHARFGVVCYTDILECEKIFPLKDENGTRKKFAAEYLISGNHVVLGVNNWARENGFTEPIKYVFEDGANGKGYLLEAITAARNNATNIDSSLIGGISFEKKESVPQLHTADKLIQQARRAIVRFNKGEETDIVIQRLIKTRLGKVFRYDSENLPLLRAIADNALLKREQNG